jgi:hypothetical protein
MIEHQVHSNAFACLPEYGQSDCGFSEEKTVQQLKLILKHEDCKMSDNNKNLVMGTRWGLYTKTDWPTDRWSQNNLNLETSTSSIRLVIVKLA